MTLHSSRSEIDESEQHENRKPVDDESDPVHTTVGHAAIEQIESELREALGDRSRELLQIISDVEQPTIGKYVIQKILGERGQAFVIQAFDPDLQRQVVVKIYRSEMPAGQKERLIQEGRSLSRVSSPYVVQCYSVDEIEGCPALVLEYVEGQTLTEFKASRNPGTRQIVALMMDLTRGVRDVHRVGLLHGDLKPENVLVTSNGRARLIDFGLSQPIATSNPFEVVGSPGYMPPERARNEIQQIDQCSDVFGIGAILYFLLYDRPPFSGSTRSEALAQSCEGSVRFDPEPEDATLVPICKAALATNPEERYQDTSELLNDLHQTLSRRPRTSLLVTAAVLMTLLAGLMYYLLVGKDLGSTGADPQSSSLAPSRPEQTPFGQRLEELKGVTEIPYVCSILKHQDDRFESVARDDRGVNWLDLDQIVYLFVNPEQPSYLTLFSIELNDGEYAIEQIYPQDAADFEPIKPLPDEFADMKPSDLLDTKGFPRISNLIQINPNTAPGSDEYFYMMLTNTPIQDSSRYVDAVNGRHLKPSSSPIQQLISAGELMRGVEIVRKRKLSDTIIRYHVRPK